MAWKGFAMGTATGMGGRGGWRCAGRMIGVLVAVCMLGTRDAHGQGSMAFSFASSQTFEATLTQAELNVFIRVLKLKPDEVEVMESLYEGYAETVRREGAKVREQMYEAIDESEMYVDPGKLQPMQKEIEAWNKRSEKLRDGLLEDIKAFLNREQEGRWPIVERELRRMRMSGGRLTGEDLDVVKLVSGLKLEPMPKDVEESLDRYSLDLDRLLLQRKAFIEENEGKFHELVKNDPAAAEIMFKDALRIRIAMRDLNERTVQQIAELLEGEKRAQLLAELDKQDAEQVDLKTRGQAQIEAALKLEDITPKEKEAVEELKSAYESQVAAWKKQMREANRRYEEEMMPYKLAVGLGREKPQDDSDYYSQWRLPEGHPVQKLRMQRYEMDKEARRKLHTILGADLRAKLPLGRQEYAVFNDRRPGGL